MKHYFDPIIGHDIDRWIERMKTFVKYGGEYSEHILKKIYRLFYPKKSLFIVGPK